MKQLERSLMVCALSLVLGGGCASETDDGADPELITSELSEVSSNALTATLTVNQWTGGYGARAALLPRIVPRRRKEPRCS